MASSKARGALTIKIHALVDGRGLPVGLPPSEAQASDCRQAKPRLDAVSQGRTFPSDKAHDADTIRPKAKRAACSANTPARRNRRKGLPLSAFRYRSRTLIERFFGKLEHARGLATRYD
ncbi:MAG: transposase [Erythrobacter sp.]|uniref:transposase n=1 Tax=Erythrobacter sp. TaxID=1042 RepID=UPI0026332AC1|nr:transposase [Erythrobacter sp.]MDJ0978571.1 transposase [Erythrobacter sp.]